MFGYDGDQLVYHMFEAGPASEGSFYVWGPTGPVAEVGTFNWTYLFDPNGNLAERVGPTSQASYPSTQFPIQGQYAIDGAYVFDAYGLNITQPGFSGNNGYNPFRYKGQAGYVSDAASMIGGEAGGVPSITSTGLVICQHRWYDPYSGRWISRDPTGLDGGENAYEYAGGNPVRDVGPSGLDRVLFIIGEGIYGGEHEDDIVPDMFVDLKDKYKYFLNVPDLHRSGTLFSDIKGNNTFNELYMPTSDEVAAVAGKYDDIVFIGHANEKFGRLRGPKGSKADLPEQNGGLLTPPVLQKALSRTGRK